MIARPLDIPDVLLIETDVFRDHRGTFYEAWTDTDYRDITGSAFVQDNHTRSHKGTVRGMHYQLPPHGQGKMLRVMRGAIFDVAVDVRRSSPTFGRWVGTELSDENHHALWIPPGFAHGILALSDTADLVYKLTERYHPPAQREIRWNDPAVGIAWPASADDVILSERDARAPLLADAEVYE